MSFSFAARRARFRHPIAVLSAVASSAWVASSESSGTSSSSRECHQEEQTSPRIAAESRRPSSSPHVPRNGSRDKDPTLIAKSILDDHAKCPETVSPNPSFSVRRRATLARLDTASTKEISLETKYELNPDPIGEGAFGQVFVARDRETGELVAVKKIWKEYSDNEDFVREMSALLKIKSHGGHPHICQLRENFEGAKDFALVLDLIKGGEMFDHLVERGAYSELDASRLIREVASALTFLHGIGLIHCDLKPENLMLSTKNDSASIKLVDFGCAEQLNRVDATSQIDKEVRKSGGTIAYSSPESFDGQTPLDAPLDMWSLGIILHIMLTGVHPFDPDGDATDETLEARIKEIQAPDLHTENTNHLSDSAIHLLSRLLEPDPSKRMKADEMLEHSWVRGLTAKSDVIEESAKKLSRFKKYQSKIETKVFQELISWSESSKANPNGESLVEIAFKSFDKDGKGFLTMNDMGDMPELSERDEESKQAEGDENAMGLSAFSDMLGKNMQNKYFPAGHVVFREGDEGKYMYFLNSGTCEVSTEAGFHHILKHGDTFGEGGLINENGRRSATITTMTPVHAIQIDRECFAKYLLGSESAFALKIKEKVNKRKFGRAEFIIGNHEDMNTLEVEKGAKIFENGEEASSIFFLVDGVVDVRNSDGNSIDQVKAGELLGFQSFFMNRLRSADAICISDTNCKVKAMSKQSFENVGKTLPDIERSLHELALRREFKRAIVNKLKSSFSKMDLREVFDAIDLDQSGKLNRDELRDLLTYLDVTVSEETLNILINTLDLDNTGFINFEEFSTLFA